MSNYSHVNIFTWYEDAKFSVKKQFGEKGAYVVAIGDNNIFFDHEKLEEFTDMLRDFMQANPVASNALGVSVAAEPVDLDDEIPF